LLITLNHFHMTTDPLAKTIQQIESACKKQKLRLFPGIPALTNSCACPTIDFAGSDWRDYLTLVSTLPHPVISLYTEVNLLTKEQIFSVRALPPSGPIQTLL
jgi:hypothetical protein